MLAALSGAPYPIGPRSIADASGVEHGYVRKLLGEMTREGVVSKVGRGRYTLPSSEHDVDNDSEDVSADTSRQRDNPLAGRSITDLLDDPERDASDPKAGLARAGGGLVARGFDAERAWEGYLSVVVAPPMTTEGVERNPLGVFVTDLSWSPLAGTGEPDQADEPTDDLLPAESRPAGEPAPRGVLARPQPADSTRP